MINNLAILSSIVAVGFVIVKAAMLDKIVPWFGRNAGARPTLGRD